MGLQLTKKEMSEFTKYLNVRKNVYRKNEVIIDESPETEQIGLVLSGMAYLCVENVQYERSILQIFQEGDYFSTSMLPYVPGGISYLIAKYHTEIVLIGRQEMETRMKENPQLLSRMNLRIANQIEQRAGSQLLWLHQKTIRRRLLYYFAAEQKRQEKETITMPIPYSDLAELLAVDRAAMMREVRRLKQEGILSGSNHTLTVNLAPMEELSFEKSY